MGNIGPQQLLIVALIFIVLFGARKLPETAKGLAQSLRVFKKELRAEEEEKQADEPAPVTTNPEEPESLSSKPATPDTSFTTPEDPTTPKSSN